MLEFILKLAGLALMWWAVSALASCAGASNLVALAIGLVVVWFVRRGWRGATADAERRDRLWDLRFPVIYHSSHDGSSWHVQADFKAMQLVEAFDHYLGGYARLFHLRRRDGVRWERCEEHASWARSLERARADKFLSLREEELGELVRANTWQPLEVAELEARYQLYLAQYRDEFDWPVTPLQGQLDSAAEDAQRRPPLKPDPEAVAAVDAALAGAREPRPTRPPEPSARSKEAAQPRREAQANPWGAEEKAIVARDPRRASPSDAAPTTRVPPGWLPGAKGRPRR